MAPLPTRNANIASESAESELVGNENARPALCARVVREIETSLSAHFTKLYSTLLSDCDEFKNCYSYLCLKISVY